MFESLYISGKDEMGWCMYVDGKRSWFMHSDVHTDRTDGGIKCGSIIGILLDLDQHSLSYFIDGEPQGPIAFSNLSGVYFPAVSINRSVQVTLHTGLTPPVETADSDDSAS